MMTDRETAEMNQSHMDSTSASTNVIETDEISSHSAGETTSRPELSIDHTLPAQVISADAESIGWSLCWHSLPIELVGDILTHLAMTQGDAGRAATSVSRSLRIRTWTARCDMRPNGLSGLRDLLKHPHSTIRATALHFSAASLHIFEDGLSLLASGAVIVDQITLSVYEDHQYVLSRSLPQALRDNVVQMAWVFDVGAPFVKGIEDRVIFATLREFTIVGLTSYFRRYSTSQFSFPSLEIVTFLLPFYEDNLAQDLTISGDTGQSAIQRLDEFFELNTIGETVPVHFEVWSHYETVPEDTYLLLEKVL